MRLHHNTQKSVQFKIYELDTPLYVILYFPLVDFKILSLSLILGNLIMMCLGVFLLGSKFLFLKRNLTGKKGLERSTPSHERQGPTSKMTLSHKAII